MENSHISWTTHTFNPWEGCTKVSPGCLHCYAENRNIRFAGGKNWGKGAPRRRTEPDNWKKPLRWNRDAEASGIRPRVFCASLADWLDDEVPIEWLSDLLSVVFTTPNLVWLLLTKRPQNWRARIEAASQSKKPIWAEHLPRHRKACPSLFETGQAWLAGTPPANVWIGTTAEDQTRADERISELIKIPAKVHFLSCEPLLGPVVLDEYFARYYPVKADTGGNMIDWVIVGGESGRGARPMNPDWARSLRDECSHIAFHFKQWGGPDNKERGRLLDGELHDALPRLSNNPVCNQAGEKDSE